VQNVNSSSPGLFLVSAAHDTRIRAASIARSSVIKQTHHFEPGEEPVPGTGDADSRTQAEHVWPDMAPDHRPASASTAKPWHNGTVVLANY
jgi:hypothetical protein